MRFTKYVFILLTIWLTTSCGHKPPVPPEPPVVKCGDGYCDPIIGETHITCPADCKEVPPPPPPPEKCDHDGKCEPGRGETKDNCVDCEVEPPPPPPPPPPADKVKDKSRLISFGYYTDVNQADIDWEYIFSELYKTPYNMFSAHWMTPWDGELMPWPKQGNSYNLDKDDEQFYKKVKEFHHWAAVYDITIEDCFFDRYFENKYVPPALNPHPFRQNNKGFNWGDDARPLFESWNHTGGDNPPESAFAWVYWKTNGKDGYDERVKSYKFVGKAGPAIERYIKRMIQIIADEKKEHPGMDTIFIRYANESYTRFRKLPNGEYEHENFGGETKIEEIFQDMFQRGGLKAGRDFVIIDDGIPIERIGNDDKLVMSEFLKSHKRFFPMWGWYHEIHGMDDREIADIMSYDGKDIGQGIKFSADKILFSTDGLKPEDANFIKICQRIYKMKNVKNIDFKVPSDLSAYRKNDFMFNFKARLPVMKKIVQ